MKKTIYSERYQQLIENLKKAREESGLTQSEAAKLLGRTQSFISKIESGQYRVDVIQLSMFAKIYAKTIRYFINE